MREELEIEIRPDGQVKVHVQGIKGSRCLEYVEVFQQILGPAGGKQLTPEYYEKDVRISTDARAKVRARTR